MGITPGILEASLVRENQREQEQRDFNHKRPLLDATVDTLDLGTVNPQPEFNPPRMNNFHQNTFDQN